MLNIQIGKKVTKICTSCAKNKEICTFDRTPLKRGSFKGYIRDLEEKAGDRISSLSSKSNQASTKANIPFPPSHQYPPPPPQQQQQQQSPSIAIIPPNPYHSFKYSTITFPTKFNYSSSNRVNIKYLIITIITLTLTTETHLQLSYHQ